MLDSSKLNLSWKAKSNKVTKLKSIFGGVTKGVDVVELVPKFEITVVQVNKHLNELQPPEVNYDENNLANHIARLLNQHPYS